MNGKDKLEIVNTLIQQLQSLKDGDMKFFDAIYYHANANLGDIVKSAYNMGAMSATALCLNVIRRLINEE